METGYGFEQSGVPNWLTDNLNWMLGVSVILMTVGITAVLALAGGQPIPVRLAAVCARQGQPADCAPRINRSLTLTVRIGVDELGTGARVGWVNVLRGRKLIAAQTYQESDVTAPVCLSLPCIVAHAWGQGDYYEGVTAADLGDLLNARLSQLPLELGCDVSLRRREPLWDSVVTSSSCRCGGCGVSTPAPVARQSWKPGFGRRGCRSSMKEFQW